jgi:hypothetical protein
MRHERDWRRDDGTRYTRRGFDRSIFLWLAIIGFALAVMIGIMMTMSGPPEFPAVAFPP